MSARREIQLHLHVSRRSWAVCAALNGVSGVFTKNRERLIKLDAVVEFLDEVLKIAEKKRWRSGEHFSVDGAQIQACASHSKVKVDDDTPPDQPGNFKGESRSNDTTNPRPTQVHGSTVRYMGHTLSDSRPSLMAIAVVTVTGGFAEREAAKAKAKAKHQ